MILRIENNSEISSSKKSPEKKNREKMDSGKDEKNTVH